LHRYATTGDAEAFSEIVGLYQDFVYGTCLRLLGNTADAEDAAQESFVSLARCAGRVTSSPGGWLHRCATGVALRMKQRQAARRRREEVHTQMKASANNGPSWDDVAPLVDQALDELPDELRCVLVEHFLRRRTQAELAAEMGVSPATVSRRVESGVEVLRKKLKKAGVVVSAVVLAALLTENAASAAAPAALTAALGKLALAGTEALSAAPVASATASTAATGLAAAAKIKIAAVIAAAVLAVGGIAAVALRPPEAAIQPQNPPAALEPAPRPSIAIHLVTEPADIREVEATPLADLRLQAEPLFTEKEIVSYDWDTHTIQLAPGVQGWPKPSVRNIPFVIVVGGQRSYVACFGSVASSLRPKMPVCMRFPDNTIKIGMYGIPLEDGILNDARNDMRIYDALKALNRLRPDNTAWGQEVNGLQAGLCHQFAARPFRIGKDAIFSFKVRNAGNAPIKLRHGIPCALRGHSPAVIDAAGRTVPVVQAVIDGPVRFVTRVVVPGETFVLDTLVLRLGQAGQRYVEPSRWPFIFVEPGICKIRQAYSFDATTPDVWSGELITGELDFKVLAAQPRPAPRYELKDLAEPDAAIYSVFNLFTADFTWLGRGIDRGELDRLLAERGTGDLGFESTDDGRLVAVRGAMAALLDAADWDAVDKLDTADVLALIAEKGGRTVSLAEFAKPPFDRKPFVAIRTASGQIAIVRAVEFRDRSVLVEVKVAPVFPAAPAVRIERLPPLTVACIRHVGPYEQTPATFTRLTIWAGQQGLVGEKPTFLEIAYDDPRVTSAEQIRCDICIAVPNDTKADGDVSIKQIDGGEFAIITHTGPFETIAETIDQLNLWLAGSDREEAESFLIVYFRNILDPEALEYITDVCVRLKPVADVNPLDLLPADATTIGAFDLKQMAGEGVIDLLVGITGFQAGETTTMTIAAATGGAKPEGKNGLLVLAAMGIDPAEDLLNAVVATRKSESVLVVSGRLDREFVYREIGELNHSITNIEHNGYRLLRTGKGMVFGVLDGRLLVAGSEEITRGVIDTCTAPPGPRLPSPLLAKVKDLRNPSMWIVSKIDAPPADPAPTTFLLPGFDLSRMKTFTLWGAMSRQATDLHAIIDCADADAAKAAGNSLQNGLVIINNFGAAFLQRDEEAKAVLNDLFLQVKTNVRDESLTVDVALDIELLTRLSAVLKLVKP
ncbi:MAG TPA: sigma-70 family RNA polymerase sigma factor, partial [Planctomycetota bacterium]|nr:sigma-70 family RNA polymerase sigma factor [Planctomycetota bacterium]